jgi:hypothetical protein
MMSTKDQAGTPQHAAGSQHPDTTPQPDPSLYERLIGDGVAAADARGGAIDHVTARRLAIWLAARPQDPDFARGLDVFTKTGAITHSLKMQLRMHARSPRYLHQPQASRLLQYCVGRGDDRGPIGRDFGGICDQTDRADVMLAGLRDRVREGTATPGQAWPDTDGPQVLAVAKRDPDGHTVSLILDEATANIAMYAITAHAVDREAHAREVTQSGQRLPEGSYGRHNRQAIAARETRVAARLRAVEQAYRAAIDRDAIAMPEPAEPPRATDPAPDREIELE